MNEDGEMNMQQFDIEAERDARESYFTAEDFGGPVSPALSVNYCKIKWLD